MNKVIYYNDDIRCYYDGRVERLFRPNCKNPEWKLVENVDNDYGYNRIGINKKMIKRHRLLAFCFIGLSNICGVKNGIDVIDHIDGNKLNNSVDNLRITTSQGNDQNRTTIKGYCWNKRANKWKAHITLNGRLIHLGYFTTEQEARQAYLNAKPIYHTIHN